MKGKEKRQEHYGLLTATTMIIGIVIGSGIFFKSDDVLIRTGGSVKLGVLVFIIGALSIIFGSLTLSELSIRTDGSGGIMSYFEKFISPNAANGFGWFQTFIYFPTINTVVSWVSAIYIFSFLGIKPMLEETVLVGLLILTFFYAVNILSYRLGGYIQNLTTIVKLIPLLFIALAGFFYHGQGAVIPEGIQVIEKTSAGLSWLAALAPIAFSFDGWVIALNITNEVKNPKKNMPLALIIGPFTVLMVYILYFLGLNHLLGSEYIMSMGNDAVNRAGSIVFGGYGERLLLLFIIIAVWGVVNGITLGSIRMPQSLASKRMLPDHEKIEKLHPKFEISLPSALISYCTVVFWMGIHYVTTKTGILGGSDISEIAIVFSYLCYILLYIKVMQLGRQHVIKGNWKGVVCPVLGVIGSMTILVGGIVANPVYMIPFAVFCSLICVAGYYYGKRKQI